MSIMRRTVKAWSLIFLAAVASGCRTWSVDERHNQADKIVFAGKVVNRATGEWPNNRLVLVFLRGKEVGRGISATGEPYRAKLGVIDGLFAIGVDNEYRLTTDEITKESGLRFEVMEPTIRERLLNDTIGDLFGSRAYRWFGDVEEGGVYHIAVPSKNLEYTMKIVQGDVATLPPEMQIANSLRLRSDGAIVVESPNEPAAAATADSSSEVDSLSVESKEDTKQLKKITVPINNCGGNTTVSQQYTQAQTFVHTYNIGWTGGVGGEIPLPLRLHLIAGLELKYGFEHGQIDTRSIEYTMAAQPHSNVRYVVTWSEVWEDGTTALEMGGAKIEVPFKVRTNLIYAVDSVPLGCP